MSLEPLLKFIRDHESRGDYNAIWGGIRSVDRPPQPLTKMTVREILRWQDRIDARYRSEAAGAYQVLEDTLRANVTAAGLSVDEKFDAGAQDRFAVHLLRYRGLDAYIAGHMTPEQFANSLAKEWASLPVVTPVTRRANGKTWVVPAGTSYYSGDGLNKALTPVAPFLAAVRAVARPVPPAPPSGIPTGKKPGPGFGLGAVVAFLLAGAGVAVTEWWESIKAAMGF